MRAVTRVVATYADVYWGTPKAPFRLQPPKPKVIKREIKFEKPVPPKARSGD